MSDFKFNCPTCGQHLMGDERYSGLKINCPACGNPVAVPAAPAVAQQSAPPAVLLTPSTPPPPPPPPLPAAGRPAALNPVAPRPAAHKTSGLAVASLICSVATFVGVPFGFIPGIICGHMAKKRIVATPGLGGAGLAKAGLIVGYIALSIYILAVVALVAFFGFFATRLQQMQPVGPGNPPFGQVQPRRSMPPMRGMPPARGMPSLEAETTDTKPDGSGWTLDLAGVTIPSGPVTGRVHGQPFKLEKATMNGGWLKLAQGKDFFADLEMDVVTFENDNAKLSGRTFTMPSKEWPTPHIWVMWKEGDRPAQRNFTDRYALRLEFGQASGGKLPGKIYVCVPDREKSFVAGTFEVELKEKP